MTLFIESVMAKKKTAEKSEVIRIIALYGKEKERKYNLDRF